MRRNISILLRGALVMAMLGAGMQAAQAALAYITNHNANTISIVDTATNTVVSQPDIGGQSTIATAVLPNGNFVYIGMRNSTLVKVLDTTSQEIVATITVGTDPAGIAALPDSSRVYVSNPGSNNVSVIDTATNAVTATIGGGGNGPFGMVASPDGNRIYVVTNSGNTITVISSATDTVLTQVSTGNMTNPYGIAISPDGNRVHAVLNTASQVAVLDTTSLTIATTCSATSAPTTAVVSADGTKLYVVDRNFSQIRVLTAATGAAITTISAAGARSTGQFITPELARLTVNAGGGQVTAKTSAGPMLSCGGAAACQRSYATTATVPDFLKPLFTFVSDALTKTITGVLTSLPSLPVQPVVLPDEGRATNATLNPIYPAMATIAAPVTVNATDTQGASYGVALNMNFQAPRQLAAMAVLSTTVDGQAVGNGASAKPALSHDGGQIADMLRYRALSGGLDRLSQSAFPTGGPTAGALGTATDPAVSNDGNHAAFTAAGQGLVLGPDTNGARQVYRTGLKYPRVDRDPATPVAELVSGTAAGVAGDGHSDAAAPYSDGRYVVLATNARDLVTGNVAAGQMMLAGNPLVDPAGTRYWYVTTGDQQSLAIERRGDRAYVASLTYDAAGNATWYAGFCGFTGLTCSGQPFWAVAQGTPSPDRPASRSAPRSTAMPAARRSARRQRPTASAPISRAGRSDLP